MAEMGYENSRIGNGGAVSLPCRLLNRRSIMKMLHMPTKNVYIYIYIYMAPPKNLPSFPLV